MSYSEETDTMTLQKENTQQKEDISSWKKYKSINYLPVDNFISVLRTGDYRYLLKLDDYEYLPKISEKENKILIDIWESVENEYYEEDKQRKIQVEVQETKKLLELQCKYILINSYIFIAPERDKYIDELEKLGYKIDRNKIAEELERIRLSTGQILTKIRIKQKEVERLQVQEKGIEFEELIDIIERHKGHYLDTSKLTVKRWIAIRNNFVKYVKEQENGRRQSRKK